MTISQEPATLRRRMLPLTAGLRSMFRGLAGWYDCHLQRRALAELDERLLLDVGLTRADVRRECRKLS
ncbi:MAG: DUF1127 domain-containing protein [Rhizobiaceae bacterium]|nr:MAG: DUF1127 domain-containing protein [Rhizobiaceae bacterium]